MYRQKAEGTYQKKHSCDNCPAHNRGVVETMFRKVKMHLCQQCMLIASRLTKQEATPITEPTEQSLPLAA